MSEEIGHNCGLCVTHSLRNAYLFIESLQHRGREATGIAAIGNKRIDVVKWKGPVNTFDMTDLYKIFPSHDYHCTHDGRIDKEKLVEPSIIPFDYLLSTSSSIFQQYRLQSSTTFHRCRERAAAHPQALYILSGPTMRR
jgi:hypothetical protein